jgi:hypothetical protein
MTEFVAEPIEFPTRASMRESRVPTLRERASGFLASMVGFFLRDEPISDERRGTLLKLHADPGSYAPGGALCQDVCDSNGDYVTAALRDLHTLGVTPGIKNQ